MFASTISSYLFLLSEKLLGLMEDWEVPGSGSGAETAGRSDGVVLPESGLERVSPPGFMFT